jgi:ribosomal protein S18 acetylase RimI-like enzyme
MLAKYHERLADDFKLAWDSRRKWAKYLKKKYSEISTKLIVASEDGKVVGFMLCLLSPNVPIYKERKIGVISDVFVNEERRRKGVMKKMFDMGIKWFRKNKVRTVQLSVAAANTEAREIYAKMGFAPFMIRKRLDLADYQESLSPRPKRILRSKKHRRRKILK